MALLLKSCILSLCLTVAMLDQVTHLAKCRALLDQLSDCIGPHQEPQDCGAPQCQNGGILGIACSCRPGFSGTFCESRLRQCPPLNPDTLPDNGGVVCLEAGHSFSTQRCIAKCNPGYEHPSRLEFVTCGPSTNWEWSHISHAPFNSCIEELFPGFRTEADDAYFVTRADLLTDVMKDQLRSEFIGTLLERGLCVEGPYDVCSNDNVEIRYKAVPN